MLSKGCSKRQQDQSHAYDSQKVVEQVNVNRSQVLTRKCSIVWLCMLAYKVYSEELYRGGMHVSLQGLQ